MVLSRSPSPLPRYPGVADRRRTATEFDRVFWCMLLFHAATQACCPPKEVCILLIEVLLIDLRITSTVQQVLTFGKE